MKILFFITVQGHGSGGHFHSLNHISRKIGEKFEVRIISIGPGNSQIIESNPHFLRHIKFTGLNFFYFKKLLRTEFLKFQPDIFHFFDVDSYNLVRLITNSTKSKIILNKCGGPNPKFYPYAKNIVLFSLENLIWFDSQKKFKASNIYLIPNRVKSLKIDLKFRPIIKNQNEFIFMRICRICDSYKKSILDSIYLISKLNENGYGNVKLYIVGVIQDEYVLKEIDEIISSMSKFVTILSDPIYTNEASKMLYLADAVIGTGRGLMEAASLGLPIFAIDKNSSTPVLLNRDNFDMAFKSNFSERNIFESLDPEKNWMNILELIKKESYYERISSFSMDCFNNFFDLDSVSDSYSNVYQKSKNSKRALLIDIILIIKTFYNFYNNYKKLNNN
ncbi:glycosyltransferase [Algoriphagus sp. AK58]|uniref:glycosyltransferase n=1 Tax=Algoriphagus sp. AK58 TaxID=1406877 RepID=UPI0016506BC5|nr:glycosyltransferase [Algoriphagus sp. AK58]MBC6369209.1 hypothetical protein [Algoriphagus sp. AK58]